MTTSDLSVNLTSIGAASCMVHALETPETETETQHGHQNSCWPLCQGFSVQVESTN